VRRRGKVDGNHAEIAQRFRDHLFSVQSLASIGDGCFDLLVARNDSTAIVEVKKRLGKLNKAQQDWAHDWRGEKFVARSVEDVDRIAANWK
jgi:metal-responsive CopG/Arc/MetJ family transcriptional regulator